VNDVPKTAIVGAGPNYDITANNLVMASMAPANYTFWVKATVTGYVLHAYQLVNLEVKCRDTVVTLSPAITNFNFIEETGVKTVIDVNSLFDNSAATNNCPIFSYKVSYTDPSPGPTDYVGLLHPTFSFSGGNLQVQTTGVFARLYDYTTFTIWVEGANTYTATGYVALNIIVNKNCDVLRTVNRLTSANPITLTLL
jgi:hypothetical protein